MKRYDVLACVLAAAVLMLGCGEDVEEGGPDPCESVVPTGSAGDGDHELEVTQPNGAVDKVWIHAVSPQGAGPFPVVVFAADVDRPREAAQPNTTLNCTPDGPPVLDDTLAQSFASLGYLAVMVGFRNEGSTAPGLGTYRPRDHYILDARAFLAAARWAMLEHGKGRRQMAFVGEGLGTLPATWATTNHPALADLQGCIDVRTLILAGGSANLVAWANSTDEDYALQSNDPLRIRARGLVTLLLQTLSSHARSLALRAESYGVGDVVAADLDAGPMADGIFQDLQVQGMSLIKRLAFQEADVNLTGCGTLASLPPLCTLDCTEWTMRSFVNFDNTKIFDLNYWATDHGITSSGWWEPPTKVSPAASDTTSSLLLDSLYQASPVYTASGSTAKSALALMSSGDYQNRPEAQQLLMDKLTSWGVAATAPAIATDPMGMPCEHEDYFNATISSCGWTLVATELAQALPVPPPMQ